MIHEKGISREGSYSHVGSGWRSLLDKFYDKAAQMPYPVHVDCVKEKFGGLRIYWNIDSDIDFTQSQYSELNGFLHSLEDRSYSICENCGDHGKIHNIRGWVKTLCIKCMREKG